MRDTLLFVTSFRTHYVLCYLNFLINKGIISKVIPKKINGTIMPILFVSRSDMIIIRKMTIFVAIP
jgi:hypothetical protein